MTRYLLLSIAIFCLVSASGCNYLKAKDRLNQGVMAYNRGEYQNAENLLKE